MSKTVCLYHDKDLDGFCSGAIVKLKYPDAEMIGYDYGRPFPAHKIALGDTLIIVDISIPNEILMEMTDLCKKVIWIDHHKTAIDDFEDLEDDRKYKIHGNLVVGLAACELSWGYFFPGTDTPETVRLLGIYDTYRKSDADFETRALPFQYGMRLQCKSLDTFNDVLFEEYEIISEEINRIIKDGENILKYQAMQDERSATMLAFEGEVAGVRAICINTGGGNSLLFKSIYDPAKHDIMVSFVLTKSLTYTFTFFSSKPEFNVGKIAKIFGGGGHHGAAGCQNITDVENVISVKG